MPRLFAFGDSFPAGAELDTPDFLGISVTEWYQFCIDNYKDNTSEHEMLVKYRDGIQKEFAHILRPSIHAFPSLIAQNLNIHCVNYSRAGTGYHLACEWAIQKIITEEIKKDDIILMGVPELYRMSYFSEKTQNLNHYVPAFFDDYEKFTNDNQQDKYRFLKEWILTWANDYNIHNQTLLNTHNLIITAKRHGVRLLIYDIFTDTGLSSIQVSNKLLLNQHHLSVGVEQRMKAWEKILSEIQTHTFMPDSMWDTGLKYSEWYNPSATIKKLVNKEITIEKCLELGTMPWFHFTKEKHQYLASVFTDYMKVWFRINNFKL